jgi:hypothetical protein
MTDSERGLALSQARTVLEQEQAYYREPTELEVRGKRLHGLGLSAPTLERLFEANARACYAL